MDPSNQVDTSYVYDLVNNFYRLIHAVLNNNQIVPDKASIILNFEYIQNYMQTLVVQLDLSTVI